MQKATAMKRFLLLLLAASALAVQAGRCQQLIIGSKAPEIKPAGWHEGRAPQCEGCPYLVEFFHSSERNAARRITVLDSLASRFDGRLAVVMVVKESADRLSAVPGFGNAKRLNVAFDGDGKTFSAFGVQFVPYAVMTDRRGRVAWLGNPASLTEADIEKIIR